MLAALLDSTTTWPDVGLAFVTILPGLLAAFYARSIHHSLKTPSGGSPGAMIEQTHHLSETTSMGVTQLVNGSNADAAAATIAHPPTVAPERMPDA